MLQIIPYEAKNAIKFSLEHYHTGQWIHDLTAYQQTIIPGGQRPYRPRPLRLWGNLPAQGLPR